MEVSSRCCTHGSRLKGYELRIFVVESLFGNIPNTLVSDISIVQEKRLGQGYKLCIIIED